MLCEKNAKILDEEIRKLEERELTHQTCDKLCTLYMIKEHMEKERRVGKKLEHHALTKDDAFAWVNGIHGEDPAIPSGGKWTTEQVKPIATKYGIPTEGERFWEFYAVMNAMYSDYYPGRKKV